MPNITALHGGGLRRWLLPAFVLALSLLVVGCGSATPAPAATTAPAATATSQPATSTPVPPTASPVPPTVTSAPASPTAAPAAATATIAPTAAPLANTDDSACVTCHTDAAALKALAKEPEAIESLSEGEG